MRAPAPAKKRKRGKRSQSFWRSKAAYTLDIQAIYAMTEDQAFWAYTALVYARTGGRPVCPHPECDNCDSTTTIRRWNPKRTVCRTIFKCKKCHRQFTPTSGTELHSRKLPFKKILIAVARFVQVPKGRAALEIMGELKCDYRVAHNLMHRIRQAVGRAADSDQRPYEGEVEADSTWVGGHMRPKNLRSETDPNVKTKNNPYRYERLGPTKMNVTAVVERGPRGRASLDASALEKDSPNIVRKKVNKRTILYTDKASVYEKLAWDVAEHFTVNHQRYFWAGDADTNTVESLFAFLKRVTRGVYHHIADPKYLKSYLSEIAWRWTHRRDTTGDRFAFVISAFGIRGKSRYKGAWQRRASAA